MKTWQRILVVTVLLGIGVAVGFKKYVERERNYQMNLQSTSNLKVIGIAWSMYADDNNDKLPVLSDAESMMKALTAYVSNDRSQAVRYFVQPRTGEPYQPNSSLSFKKRQRFNYPSQTVVVYEVQPAEDGTRGVLFADCHVERVNETRWQELKKSSNIL